MHIDTYFFEQIDSTNSFAKENLHHFDPEHLTLIHAKQQLKGRGRFQRHWLSPPSGNIYASYCLFLKKEELPFYPFTQLLALAAAKMAQENGFSPKLKWPNDLLLSGKKWSGILTEAIEFSPFWALIIGIGININMKEEELAAIGQPATSFYAETGKQTGKKYDCNQLLEQMTAHFLQNRATFLQKGFSPFLPYFQSLQSLLPGDSIHLRDGVRHLSGTVHEVTPSALYIRSGEQVIACQSGELV